MSRATLFFVFLGFQLLQLGSSQSVTNSNLLISNGLDDNKLVIGQSSSSIVQVVVDELKADTVTCEPIYGFLPCATSVWWLQLLMIIVYEVLLCLANLSITTGSNLLVARYGKEFLFNTVYHILGTLPQVVIVLVNGVTGDTDTAEAMATMSMALLVGSAIMLLTIVWGIVVAFGSEDIPEPECFNFAGRAVTTTGETRYTAAIIFVSLIPFFILLVAKFISSTSGIRIVTLVALLVTISLLVVYFVYQIFFNNWIIGRRRGRVNRENEVNCRENEVNERTCWNSIIMAAFLIVLGIIITGFLAYPLLQTTQSLSTLANIPSFVTSYVLIPLAINLGQIVQAFKIREAIETNGENENAVSSTLLEIYNGVFMNNILGLTIFLGLVYIRDLSWEVSADVYVVVGICLLVGFYNVFCNEFPRWTSIIAFILYAVSLGAILLMFFYDGPE